MFIIHTLILAIILSIPVVIALIIIIAMIKHFRVLQVGNAGLTLNEQRSHFALWAILKSPLFIGADLRSLSKEAKEILTAPEVIAVNQDPLGVAGDLIWKQGPIEVSCCLTDVCACQHALPYLRWSQRQS